jgi:flagellar biosynthesis protein FliQ
MDVGSALDFVQETLILALLISAPMLLCGMVVGVLVSLFQAVTQIQEQTLTFVPKIAAMVCAAVVLMPWIIQKLLDYSAALFGGGQLP